jgi:hypothetical protein
MDRTSPGMRADLYDTEWDGACARHDLSVPAVSDAEPEVGTAPPGTRKVKRRALLVLVALAMPMQAPRLSEHGAAHGIPREALFSFSPAEMLLPPVDVALARLAAESASASCWVQQLRPQGGDCAAR